MPNLTAFLFDLLQTGNEKQNIASFERKVITQFTLVVTGNPKNPQAGDMISQKIVDAMSLMFHMTENLAFGRRIGIFRWGNQFRMLKSAVGVNLDDRTSPDGLRYMKMCTIFKQIQKQYDKQLMSIWYNKRVQEWLDTTCSSYNERLGDLASLVEQSYIKGFMLANASDNRHLRGHALKCAIFAEIYDRFGANPSDEQLRHFLRERAIVDISEASPLALEIGRLLKKVAPYLKPHEQKPEGQKEAEERKELAEKEPETIALTDNVLGELRTKEYGILKLTDELSLSLAEQIVRGLRDKLNTKETPKKEENVLTA